MLLFLDDVMWRTLNGTPSGGLVVAAVEVGVVDGRGGGALMSAVPAKKTYGLTCMRFGQRDQTSSRSSIMATISSPQGNTDLHVHVM